MRDNNIAVAFITETWNVCRNPVLLTGYSSEFVNRHDRGINRTGGVVGIFWRKDVPPSVLSNFELKKNHFEVIWLYCKPVKLPWSTSCQIFGLVHYPESSRCCNELVSYMQNFVDWIRSKYSAPGICILGDFIQTSKSWLRSSFCLKQVVKTPAHISGSILDLILTNFDSIIFIQKPLIPWARQTI